MAKKDTAVAKTAADDFTSELISSLNKDHGSRIAYNLAVDTSPTHVKRWISSGSKQLDLVISNRAKGGLPEGRIVEIFGPPSIGKSHIATQIARSTQSMGGIVVYIDTENGTSVENLAALGVDVSKRFVYVDTHCTEEVLDIAEKTILKAKAMAKDVPITIIWDSVAASSPKAELEGAYDKDTIGLQARAISKGMRKITGVIGDQNVLFVILNQIRTKIGVMHGDPTTTPAVWRSRSTPRSGSSSEQVHTSRTSRARRSVSTSGQRPSRTRSRPLSARLSSGSSSAKVSRSTRRCSMSFVSTVPTW